MLLDEYMAQAYPGIRECLLLSGALDEKQFAFTVEHNSTRAYYVNIMVLAEIVAFRYCVVLQR